MMFGTAAHWADPCLPQGANKPYKECRAASWKWEHPTSPKQGVGAALLKADPSASRQSCLDLIHRSDWSAGLWFASHKFSTDFRYQLVRVFNWQGHVSRGRVIIRGENNICIEVIVFPQHKSSETKAQLSKGTCRENKPDLPIKLANTDLVE